VDGLTDAELLKRLSAIYNEAFVAGVATELAEVRKQVADGLAEEAVVVKRIHERFTYRMHDLGEFMKGVLQRYTQWHNRKHSRTGRLWEDRFKSVIVEDGVAARTMAAYIDLNPVRAGMVQDPAEYRWSSYGEAIGSGSKGHGRTARAGLVRAWGAHQGMAADAALWAGEIPFATILRHRIRYFTDGAVIGSRSFVDEVFTRSRDRFGPKRKSGARRMKGDAASAGDSLWSLRDLRKGIV
jgi:hypothetical protein